MKTKVKGGKVWDLILRNDLHREAHPLMEGDIVAACRQRDSCQPWRKPKPLSTTVPWPGCSRGWMPRISHKGTSSETQLVATFCEVANAVLKAAVAVAPDSTRMWSTAAAKIGLLPWEVKKLSLDGMSGPRTGRMKTTTTATQQQQPQTEGEGRRSQPAVLDRGANECATGVAVAGSAPALATAPRVGKDNLGVPKLDAVFVRRKFLHFKPSEHDLAHDDALGFAEFKLSPKTDDIVDAVEQSCLQLLIQRDLQPLGGDSVSRVVSEDTIRPWYAKRGLVSGLAKRASHRNNCQRQLWIRRHCEAASDTLSLGRRRPSELAYLLCTLR